VDLALGMAAELVVHAFEILCVVGDCSIMDAVLIRLIKQVPYDVEVQSAAVVYHLNIWCVERVLRRRGLRERAGAARQHKARKDRDCRTHDSSPYYTFVSDRQFSVSP
jgi:hypothetical protein